MNRLIIVIFSLLVVVSAYPQDSLWYYVPVPPDNPINAVAECNNRLYISGYRGVFFTENDGKTWQQVYQPKEPLEYFYSLSVTKKKQIIGYYITFNPLSVYHYYISCDAGASWQPINIEKEFYSIDGDTAGVLWGACNQGIFKSYDNGASWEILNIEKAIFYSVFISKKNHIFLAAKDKIFRSSDNGVSWQVIPAGQENRLLQADDNGNYYAFMTGNGYQGLYISRDGGLTWEQRSTNLPSYQELFIDKFGRLFSQRQISTDTGKTWKEYIHPIPNTDHQKCIFNGTLYTGGHYYQSGGFLYKLNNNYVMPAQTKIKYPLNKNNRWQYKYIYSYWGAPVSRYEISLINVNITADTVIGNKTYFKRSDYPNDWLRFSEDDNKLYAFRNGTDSVRIDFNVPDGGMSNSLSSNYNGNVGKVTRGSEICLGSETPYFQIKEEFYRSSNTYRYNSQLGLTLDFFSFYSMGSGSGEKTKSLMQAYIVEDGTAKFYGNKYAPVINITPPKILTDSLFQFCFKVSHPENVNSNSLTQLPYIDSVYFLGYYKKDDKIIGNIKLSAEYLLGTEMFSIDTSLSDNLLRQGYEFFFNVVAVDKSLVPQRSFAPANGYYSVKYNGFVDVRDKELKEPKDFCLDQNYPNPANPASIITYSLPRESRVKMTLYNSVGQLIKILVDDIKPAGSYRLLVDGSSLPSGVYFYNIQAEGFSRTRKLIIMK